MAASLRSVFLIAQTAALIGALADAAAAVVHLLLHLLHYVHAPASLPAASHCLVPAAAATAAVVVVMTVVLMLSHCRTRR